MKLLIVLVGLVGLANAGGGKEERMFKTWAKMKAMESCYGEDSMKQHILKAKRAIAKCTKTDMPELDLPMFTSPYRPVQALLNGAQDMEQLNIERFQKLMKTIQQNTGTSAASASAPLVSAASAGGNAPQFIPIPFPTYGQQQAQAPQMDPVAEMMKKMFMKNMMKKFMANRNNKDDDGDDDMFDFSGGDEEFAEMLFSSNKNPFFKSPRSENRRSKRQSELYELGDRLADKLSMQQEEMKAKIGNMTCILQELKVVDSELELDLQGMLEEIDTYDIRDNWLYERTKEDCRTCYAFAQSLPQRLFDMMPWPEQMVKVKKFMMCEKKMKMMTSMNFDIKRKLEENFGPLNKLVDQTGLEEKMLLPMAMKLLHGDMEMMMDM